MDSWNLAIAMKIAAPPRTSSAQACVDVCVVMAARQDHLRQGIAKRGQANGLAGVRRSKGAGNGVLMKKPKTKLATVCLRGVYLFTQERIRPVSVAKIVQALWEASFSFPGSLTPFCKMKCQFC